MKVKVSRILVFSLLLITMLLAFGACPHSTKLDTPTGLTLEDNLLTWNAVPNASSYIVSVQGEENPVTQNQFYVLVDNTDEYGLQVKAVGDGKNFIDSDYSETVIYTPNIDTPIVTTLPRLSTPSNLNALSSTLSWNAVTNAISYTVKVKYPNSTEEYFTVESPSYSLTYTVDGIHWVYVKANPNPLTHKESYYSAGHSYEVLNHQPVYNTLIAPRSFTYSGGLARWSKVNNAIGYVISVDGVDTVTINSGLTTSYDLELEPGSHTVRIKSVGDEINYKSSVYSSAINFPLSVNSAPSNISITSGIIRWDEMEEASGYKIMLNGAELETIEETSFQLDFTQDGLNIIRIKAVGDNTFYSDSPYSVEIAYYASAGGPVAVPLGAPQNLSVTNTGILSWDTVVLAESYYVTIDESSGLFVDGTQCSVGTLNDGVHSLTVKALGDGIYTADSPSSRQMLYISGTYSGLVILDAPYGLKLDGDRVTWGAVEGASGYEVIVNGQDYTLDMGINFITSIYFSAGDNFIKVKALGDGTSYDDSLYSEEIYLVKPVMLTAPVNVRVTGNKLIWDEVPSADFYTVEISDGEAATRVASYVNYYDLNIDEDGFYIIRVRADAETENPLYVDSLFSAEVKYTRNDGGLGGADNPYLIDSIEKLFIVRDFPTYYYKLTTNLNLEGIDFEPLCNTGSPFTGYFDGDGYVISNVSISGERDYAGLFGYIDGGTVRDLTVNGVNILVNNYVDISVELEPEEPVGEDEEPAIPTIQPAVLYAGGLVGYGRNVYIDNVEVTEVSIIGISNTVYAGLIGGVLIGEVRNVEGKGSIQADSSINGYAGGIAGYSSGILVNAIVGSITEDSEIINNADENAYSGGISGEIASGIVSGISVYITIDSEAEGIFSGGVSGLFYGDAMSSGSVELIMTLNGSTVYVGGIASYADEAEWEDFDVLGSITAQSDTFIYAGGAVAKSSDLDISTIDVTVDYTLGGVDVYAGGIIGNGKGNITYSSYSGTISIEALAPPEDEENPEEIAVNTIYAGGIAGYLEGNIMACDSAASITLSGEYTIAYAGSLAGLLKGLSDACDISVAEIEALTAAGDIYTGGAIGSMYGNLEDCTLNGAVVNVVSQTGNVYAGALIGKHNSGALSGSTAVGSVTAAGTIYVYAGGLSGYSSGAITTSNSECNVQAVSTGDSVYAGGITGNAQGTISNSMASGSVTASGAGVFAGGIAGIAGKEITGVSFTGSVAANCNIAFVPPIEEEEEPEEGEEPTGEGEADYTSKYIALAGGIAGKSLNNITSATVNLTVINAASLYGNAYGGGISGEVQSGTLTALTVTSSGDREIEVIAKADAYSGGITGLLTGNIIASYSGGEITVYGAVTDIDVSAETEEGIAYAGGITGMLKGSVNGVITHGAVNSQSDTAYSGGVSGVSDNSFINDVASYCDVIADAIDIAYIGGINGNQLEGNVQESIYAGSLSATAEIAYIGGISGNNGGNISDSTATIIELAYLADTLYIGGISGIVNDGSISACYTLFSFNNIIDNVSAYAGGIAGSLIASGIVNCYSVLDVDVTELNDEDYIGGLTGLNQGGQLINSYVTGIFFAEKAESAAGIYAGKIAGASDSDAQGILSDKLMASNVENIGSGVRIGISAEFMGAACTASAYSGWDADVWTFTAHYYPRLSGVSGQDTLTSATSGSETIMLSPDSESLDLAQIVDYTFNTGAIFKSAYYTVEDNDHILISPDGRVDLYLNSDEGITVTATFEGNITVSLSVQAINVEAISGAGTSGNPYLVDSLRMLNYMYFRPNAYYSLLSDIDLTGLDFEPIGTYDKPFTGGLDGNGHTITGLTPLAEGDYTGFFGYLSDAEIIDVNFDSAVIDCESVYGTMYAGIVAGYAENVTIENVEVNGTLTARSIVSGIYAGGLFGYGKDVTVESAYVSADVNATCAGFFAYAGGLMGYLKGDVSVSYFNGNIILDSPFGVAYTGGIAGYAEGSEIIRSYAKTVSEITSDSSIYYAGGLLGYIGTYYSLINVISSVSDCYASTAIDIVSTGTTSYTGGLIGNNEANLARCFAMTSAIEGTYSGELIGSNSGVLSECMVYLGASSRPDAIGDGEGDIIEITGDELMSGTASIGWDNWSFTAGRVMRLLDNTGLAEIPGQTSVTSAIVPSMITIEAPEEIFNILDFVTIEIDSAALFNCVKITTSDENTLIVFGGVNIMPIADGTAAVTFTFDGGEEYVVNVTLTGCSAPLFAGGHGTEADPFIISTPSELLNIALYPMYFYALGNDMDFTGTTNQPIGTEEAPFTGGFDGATYDIINLTGTLFGYTEDAILNAISIVEADITADNEDYAGIIALVISGGSATGCVVDVNSVLIADSGYIGGLFGMVQGATVENCVNNMAIDVTGTDSVYLGGIAGYAYDSTFIADECTATVNLTATALSYIGGIIGYASEITFGPDEYESSIVEESIEDPENPGQYILVSVTVYYPVMSSETLLTVTCNADTDAYVYAGGISGMMSGGSISYKDIESYVTGDSTDNSGRLIIGGLFGITQNTDISNLILDTTVSADTDNIVLAGGISGDATGCGFTNIQIASDINITTSKQAYIGGVSGGGNSSYEEIDATISIIADVDSVLDIGGIAVSAADINNLQGAIEIEAIALDGIIRIGGIVASGEDITLDNDNYSLSIAITVERTLPITPDDLYVGGLAGVIDTASITNFEYSMDINVTLAGAYDSYIGGMAGHGTSVNITSCSMTLNSLSVTGESVVNTGGYLGYSIDSTFEENEITGAISTDLTDEDAYLGGLTGYSSNSTYVDSTIDIDLSATAVTVYGGGLAGYLENCVVESDEYAVMSDNATYAVTFSATADTAYIGAVAGYIKDSSITYKDITITLEAASLDDAGTLYAGGLAGYVENVVFENLLLESTLDVDSEYSVYAGGLFGKGSAAVSEVEITLSIDIDAAEDVSAGGLAGEISECFSGAVSGIEVTLTLMDISCEIGDINAGGYAGINNVFVSDIVVNGAITITGLGAVTAGGISGQNLGGITLAQSSVILSLSFSVGALESATVGVQNYTLGGISGINLNNINQSLFTGSVSLTYNIEGSVEIEAGASDHMVYVGGIAGDNQDNINESASTGSLVIDYNIATTATITGESIDRYVYIGGAAGYNSGMISNCYNSGGLLADISGANLYAGGFVGMMPGASVENMIDSSYACGTVSVSFDSVNYPLLSSNIGGFIGYSETELVTVGDEPDTFDVYTGMIVSCYYDTDTVDDAIVAGYSAPIGFYGAAEEFGANIIESEGKTTAELKEEDTYPVSVLLVVGAPEWPTWSDEIWNISDGSYPTLNWMI